MVNVLHISADRMINMGTAYMYHSGSDRSYVRQSLLMYIKVKYHWHFIYSNINIYR